MTEISGYRQVFTDINVVLPHVHRVFAGVTIRVICVHKIHTDKLILQEQALVLALARIRVEIAKNASSR